VSNKVGVLAEILRTLGTRGINLLSIVGETFGDQGVIRMITSDADSALKALKEKRYPAVASEVIKIKVRERPGELAKVVTLLARNKINIECVYLLSRGQYESELALKVDKTFEAKELLEKHKII
jgi:hypothetical protein